MSNEIRLNKEQEKIVNSPPYGHMAIRGIAGAGKTTIGVERIKYLIENVMDHHDKILFVTYNKSLCNYIKQICNRVMNTSEEVFLNQVDIKTIDAIAFRYFKQAENTLNIQWQITNDDFNTALQIAKEKYPNCKYLESNYKKFLLDEIKWIKGCNYNTIAEYQNVERLGRMSSKEGGYRIGKDSINREAIYFLKDVLNQLLREKNLVDGVDGNKIALDYILSMKNVNLNRYSHIIIDEAQDLTKVQLDIINNLSKNTDNSSIWLLMDVAQSIYPQAWLVKGRTFKSIGYDIHASRSHKLNKNYRTTTEISRCAYSLLSYDEELLKDENFIMPTLLAQHGYYPMYRNFDSYQEQSQYIVKLIKQLNKEFALKDIAIVAKLKKSLQQYESILNWANINSEIISSEMNFNVSGNSETLITSVNLAQYAPNFTGL